MSLVRLHIAQERWQETVELTRAEQRHLVDVLRLRPDDQVQVFDGQGGLCQARLMVEDDRYSLGLGERISAPADPPSVYLALALLKGPKLDQVVRMLTEIGVAGVIPFTCERSIPRLERKRSKSRVERWRTISVEAARQSGRAWVPQIEEVMKFGDMLSSKGERRGLLLHEKAPTEQGVLMGSGGGSAGGSATLLAIGPEGGFSEAEVELAQGSGFRAVGLGLPILRAQTAAVVAAAFACLRPSQGASPDPSLNTQKV